MNTLLAQQPPVPVDPLLTDKEVATILGVSRNTIWRRVADGTLPKPVRLGALSRFPHSEVMAALERIKAKRAA